MRGEILHLQFGPESIDNIAPFHPLYFLLHKLFHELVNKHIAAANAHLNLLSLVDLEVDALLPELVYALGLPEEHDLHLVAFRVRVDVVGQVLVDFVESMSDIDHLGVGHAFHGFV